MKNVTQKSLLDQAAQHGATHATRLQTIFEHAGSKFPQFFAKGNKQALTAILSSQKVVNKIVFWLKENEKNNCWPLKEEDQTIRQVVETIGLDYFPPKQLQKRWFYLVCIAACLIEGYSYGNMLSTQDYL